MTDLISVIISTYNKPEYLRLTLASLQRQTDAHFEVIVADDGSDGRTARVVEEEKIKFRVPVTHVWQPKKGFRLAAVRNRAVEASHGSYLIFIDGDCIAPSDFVSTHRALAEHGWHVVGQRVLLSESFSKRLLSNSNIEQSVFPWSPAFILKRFISGDINRLFAFANLPLGRYRYSQPKAWSRVRGCNWAMWADDYRAVNGSDEAFEGWGAEDTDLAIRLFNYGVKTKLGVCASRVLHLWHEPHKAVAGSTKKDELIQRRILSGDYEPTKGMRFS